MRGKQRHTIHFSRGKSFSVDELYDCFYDELVLWADTILNDMGEAEDLVQDVIYDFWKQRQHLSELSSLKSWLYISVRNRCINYLEHDKVKKKYLQLNGEAEADFFLSQIIEEEVYLALKQAIDILPPKIRTIFYLILERKTNAEIASLLGITEEAVKAYRKRGMKMLRIRLSNFWILALLIF